VRITGFIREINRKAFELTIADSRWSIQDQTVQTMATDK
jgi:hypothetical protein